MIFYYSVKTPGGRLVYQYIGKTGKVPRCGECGVNLAGIPALRPYQYKNLPKSRRTVSRAYGGSKCAKCVRNRIVRAFLIEEQKTAKIVFKKQQKDLKQKKDKKSSK